MLRSHRKRHLGQRRARRHGRVRRGSALFLAITLGVAQVSRLYDVQNVLSMATRDAARLAAMDREGILSAGTSMNQKMTDDVTNFLEAAGLPTDKITVAIKDHANPSTTINLSDPANDHKLFDLTVEMPYSSFSSLPVPESQDFKIKSKIVFRNGRSASN